MLDAAFVAVVRQVRVLVGVADADVDDLGDAGYSRERDQLARPIHGELECRAAVIEADVVRVDQHVSAAKRLLHPHRRVEVVRETLNTLAKTILFRTRRETPDLGAIEETLG